MTSSRIESLEPVNDVDRASIHSCDVEAAWNNDDSQTGVRARRLGRLKVKRSTLYFVNAVSFTYSFMYPSH